MYKTRNKSKKICIIGGCLFSLYFWYTVAWSINGNGGLFDDLLKLTQDSYPIDKIFDGNISVENPYKQALKMIRSESMGTLKECIEDLTKIITEESKSSINQKDVINILYDTNIASKKIAKLMWWTNKLDDDLTISENEINASYNNLSKKIAVCKKNATESDNGNLNERICIKKRFKTTYINIEKSKDDVNIIKSENFWEDLFSNWSLEDSEYDILIDINNIWNLLFTSFIGPTETLFYKKPTVKKWNSQNTAWWDMGTLTDILNNLNTNGNTGNGSNGSNGNTGNSGSGSGETTNNTTSWNWTNNTKTDTELEQFISTTHTQNTSKTSSSSTTNNTISPMGINQWNMCVATVSGGNSNTITTTMTEITDITTIEQYLNEIDKKNDGVIVVKEYGPPPLNEWNNENQNNTTTNGVANQLIEEKIDAIFDEDSVKKCTEKCTVGTDVEKAICKIECLCFSLTYPKTGIEGLDGQMKLRFCTIPVQKNRISKQKDILWRDDSLSRIKSVFEKLTNGWEMVKYERPKEYLESPIWKIERSKYLSFEMKLYIKSLFQNTSKKDRETKAKKERELREKSVKTDTPEVVTDPNKFKVSSKTEDTSVNYDRTERQLDKVVQTARNKKNIMFNEKIGLFLEENDKFWFNIIEEINKLNNWITTIKNKLSSMQ